MNTAIGMTVDVAGDGTAFGTVTAFSERGATVEVATLAGIEVHATNSFSGLYARIVAALAVEPTPDRVAVIDGTPVAYTRRVELS